MMKYFLFLAPCLVLALFASAVPLRFDAPADSTKTFQASAYHGETLEIEAQLTWRNAPLAIQGDASATMLWQTNGMNEVWWTAPASVSRAGLVSATWSPKNDVGADLYRVFLLVSGDGGASYRANLILRLLGSPGATPNALPLPAPFIDFAKIAVTNEPWSVSSGLTTNDVRNIVEAGGVTITGKVTFAGANYPLDDAISVIGGRQIRTNGNSIEIVGDENSLSVRGMDVDIPEWDSLRSARGHQTLPDYIDSKTVAATNGLASAEEVAAARTEASLVYQLMMGSNVVAEVTNYNSAVRSPQLRLLQLEEGEYKTVWAETNGLVRTLAAAGEYTDAVAATKADRAWGKYTSGLGADAPSNTTWVSTPLTVIAGGYEYARYLTTAGEAWVLTSNGMVAGPDTNAYFRVASADGETLFSIEKTDAVLIGVDAGGIRCAGNTVTILIDAVSAEAPVCYATDDLTSGTWYDLTSGTLPGWITAAEPSGSAGAWVWTITTTSPKGFFQFRALQEGSTVIRNNALTDLSQGIVIDGVRYRPVVSGSAPNRTITWTEAH